MGSGQSVEIPGGGTEGYHVLRVQENSPGAAVGIEAFFDFIVALNGVRLDQDNETLREILKANIDKPVAVTLYNSKSRQVREVSVTPSAVWGGQGLLGVSIRFCSFQVSVHFKLQKLSCPSIVCYEEEKICSDLQGVVLVPNCQ